MTDYFKNRRIVLVGGAGFIGHNLALTLAEKGANVHVIDGLQVNNLLYFTSRDADSNNRDLYVRVIQQRLELMRQKDIPLYVQDARDYHALSALFDRIKPHAVVHLAAVAHAGRSNKDPYSTFDHSLRTLENVLDASRGLKVDHIVYFSSSMVYGNFLTPEVDEEHGLNPIGIYGALKVAGEKMVIAYNQVFGNSYTIVRPSALYGPRCVSRRVGQVFIENAIQGKNLQVDGDGQERLDFTFIDDLVQGLLLVLENPNARNQIFNLTYGRSRSIGELVNVIKNEFPAAKIERVERDKLMPFRGTLSIKKAQKLLGYTPQNPIETGFQKYIDWYRQFMQGSNA